MRVDGCGSESRSGRGRLSRRAARRTPSGDAETLRIAETGPNTGIFVGYIQTRAAAVTAGNCVLEVERNAQIRFASTSIAVDAADTSSASALVDPYGLIFDSRTGAPINGARVRLIDATTGVPAAVVGDDGVSSYPSEMVTGSPVTDARRHGLRVARGRVPLPAGRARQLSRSKSTRRPATRSRRRCSIADLGQTPGGPYRLSAGSFGAPFAADTPPAVAVDVPLDAAATQLFMQKTHHDDRRRDRRLRAVPLAVENTSTQRRGRERAHRRSAAARRALSRQARRASTAAVAPDPEISADGRTLTFTSGALGAGPAHRNPLRRRDHRRRARQATRQHRACDRPRRPRFEHGAGDDPAARRAVPRPRDRDGPRRRGRLRERRRTQLAGRRGRARLPRRRPLLGHRRRRQVSLRRRRAGLARRADGYGDDSRYASSALAASDRVRNAGRAYSQFVDVRGGALWRSDFVLARRLAAEGLAWRCSSRTAVAGPTQLLAHRQAECHASCRCRAARVHADAARRPRVSGAAARRLDGQTIADPAISSNVLTFALGDVAADRAGDADVPHAVATPARAARSPSRRWRCSTRRRRRRSARRRSRT